MRSTSHSTRGILYPARLPQFHRISPATDLAEVVRWFWVPEWNIEPGRSSRQHLIAFAACNLVVEQSITTLSGPTTRASYRDLRGEGWAVGALLQPAAVPTIAGDPAAIRDRSIAVGELDTIEPRVFDELSVAVRRAMTADAVQRETRSATATEVFSHWLRTRLHFIPVSPEGVLANRLVAAAESEPDIVTVAHLADHLNVSVRSVQRLAAKYVGVSPTSLIRRRRLQEAAEMLRQQPEAHLAEVAHAFGYADHAHLTHDFRATLGFTPSVYRRESRG